MSLKRRLYAIAFGDPSLTAVQPTDTFSTPFLMAFLRYKSAFIKKPRKAHICTAILQWPMAAAIITANLYNYTKEFLFDFLLKTDDT